MSFTDLIDRAVARRASLAAAPDTNAFRVFNGAGDGVPGLTVDRFDAVLVVNRYAPHPVGWEGVVRGLAEAWGARSVYVKERPIEASKLTAAEKAALAPATPWWGEPIEELSVRENGLQFVIRPGEGLSVGLFLDMREARAAVRAQAANRTVLNCFAYTCGFGVAALAGGAGRAVNLDVSKPYLAWGKRNTALNGFTPVDTDFIFGDVFDWLKRWGRSGQQFELVILDPPSYATTKHSRFSVEKDYAGLVALALPLVAPGGMLLACANTHTQAPRAFRAQVEAGLKGTTAKIQSMTHETEVDFPRAVREEAYLKVCQITLGGKANR